MSNSPAPHETVSVIIPVYMAEAFVEIAVDSALEQQQTLEVILIEDGSSDRSLAVCTALEKKESKVRVLQHPAGANRGSSASRNVGIQNAKGAFVAFLDADDYYLPGRFNVAVDILLRDAAADGVYEAIGTDFHDERAKKRWFSHYDLDLTTLRENVAPERLFEALVHEDKGRFSTDGITVRKSVFERVGYFDEELEVREDTAMWVKMSALLRLLPGRLTEPVAMRRVHDGNRMLNDDEKFRYYWEKMWEILFAWGYGYPLSLDRQGMLLEEYLAASESWSCRTRFWRVRKARGLLRLPSLVFRYPRILTMMPLWEYVSANVREVMRILGKGSGT